MKEKILYLILGILIGAVITAFCFVVYSRTSNNNGGMSGMPSGRNFDMEQMTDENGNTINMDRMPKGDMHQNENTVNDSNTEQSTENQTSNS